MDIERSLLHNCIEQNTLPEIIKKSDSMHAYKFIGGYDYLGNISMAHHVLGYLDI